MRLNEGLEVNLISPDEVPDDALVIPTAVMGAPTVLIEKLPSGDEPISSLQKLEEHLGKKAHATMPIEVGGINSTNPLVVGARLGLPIVDADGMGRAFPELQMETFGVYGVSGSPMVVSNEHGDSVLLTTRDNKILEAYSRAVTIRMGGSAYIAVYPMTGAEVKRTAVPNTLTLAMRIGRELREAKAAHLDPFEALQKFLPDTHYSFGQIIFKGKISDIQRETREGFAVGEARIEGLDNWQGDMHIEIQNENLIARVGGEVRAIVPDLICIMDSETAEPIITERLHYGQRVTVMAVSVPEMMRSPEALKVFDPRCFGFDHDFVPIETLARQT